MIANYNFCVYKIKGNYRLCFKIRKTIGEIAQPLKAKLKLQFPAPRSPVCSSNFPFQYLGDRGRLISVSSRTA